MAKSVFSTEQRIEYWAQWSRAGSPIKQLGYKSPGQILIEQNTGGGLPTPPIPDEEALIVDAAVSRLKTKYEHLHYVFVLHFIYNWNVRKIADEIGSTRTAIHNDIGVAIAWLDGQLTENNAEDFAQIKKSA